MTAFYQAIGLASNKEGPFVEVRALVDTGATFTLVPRNVLQRLGVSPDSTMEFETADGRVIQREVAEAVVRIDGTANTTKIIFGDEGTEALLGVHTLEAFLLAADPVNERLVPVRGLLKASRICHCEPFEYVQDKLREAISTPLYPRVTEIASASGLAMTVSRLLSNH